MYILHELGDVSEGLVSGVRKRLAGRDARTNPSTTGARVTTSGARADAAGYRRNLCGPPPRLQPRLASRWRYGQTRAQRSSLLRPVNKGLVLYEGLARETRRRAATAPKVCWPSSSGMPGSAIPILCGASLCSAT